MDYAKIKALAMGATPGPWHECPMRMFVFGPGGGDMIASTDDNGELLVRGHGARLPMEANAAYLAHVDPTTVLGMIAEIERLREDASRERYEDRKADQRREHAVSAEFARLHAEAATLRVRAEKAESHRDQLMRWIGDLGVRLGVLASENEPWKFATIARAAETLKRERDARPAITPEMARDVIESWDDSVAESGARDGTKSFTEWDVIMRALRSHAAKAVKT